LIFCHLSVPSQPKPVYSIAMTKSLTIMYFYSLQPTYYVILHTLEYEGYIKKEQ
jgi:hypothetical protein